MSSCIAYLLLQNLIDKDQLHGLNYTRGFPRWNLIKIIFNASQIWRKNNGQAYIGSYRWFRISLKAAVFAGGLARLMQAKVSIQLVQDEHSIIASAWNAIDSHSSGGPVEDARTAIEKQAYEQEMAATKSALGNIPEGIELFHHWGQPANEICKFVKENNVDHIVMGSHGRSGIQEMMLGSVSHAVVNKANCAVTIVR
jgi:nucleotide-binding universal stress UspA family protein